LHAEPKAPIRALLDDRLALILNHLSVAPVVAIIALMVFEPGGCYRAKAGAGRSSVEHRLH
jgi:hypothetical protein